MSKIIKCNTYQIDDITLFVRSGGEGIPVLLLHPSPLDGSMFVPFIQKFNEGYQVFAPDTPGYGLSTLPSKQPETLHRYAEYISLWLKEMKIDKAIIYGSATGAQIAIRMGLDYPEQVHHLFLDNTAHFTDEECADILKHYFPDFTPRDDGSHLTDIWHVAKSQFEYFPWCFQDDAHKVHNKNAPLALIQYVANAYIQAGATYDWAYRVAFEHERKEKIHQLKVPTHLFYWKGSILGEYMERLCNEDFPENVTNSEIAAEESDRYAVMVSEIDRLVR